MQTPARAKAWRLDPEDKQALSECARRMQLSHHLQNFLDFAQYLWDLTGDKDAWKPKCIVTVLEQIEREGGYRGNGSLIELLFLCCLAITHSKKRAIHLIQNYSRWGKPLRKQDSLKAHYKRLRDNLMIPERFTSRYRGQQQLSLTSGDEWDYVPTAYLDPLLQYGNMLGIPNMVQHARDCARYLQLARSSTTGSADNGPLDFIKNMIQVEGYTSIGAMASLLLIACILIEDKQPCTGAKLISSYVFEGKPLRNFDALRKFYQRMKARGRLPPELL